MEHHINSQVAAAVGPGGIDLSVIQLEGGDEECQIKRIVLSGATTGGHMRVRIGLFQDIPASTSDFNANNGSAVFYAFACAQQALINETTTIRVPRDWYIGILAENLAAVASTDMSVVTQLNYKVLS